MIGGVVGNFLAMLAGFALMAGLVSAVTASLPRVVPEWINLDGSPRRPLIIVNLCWSFLAAGAGGYLTAWIARENPLDTALALAIVILVLSAIGTFQSRERYPLWYLMLLLIVTPIGVITGGILRVEVLRAL
ncbi:hypothetical protein DYQ86_13745 [Acidobacteria bacterium AB60]|nr:hypothetical protein DYQ86_13745 [Acidobacteria bacterium AB60]